MGATQKLTEDQARARLQAGCPACGAVLKVREIKLRNAETGLRDRSDGVFLGCSRYGRGCKVDYYLSMWTLIEKIVPGKNEVVQDGQA